MAAPRNNYVFSVNNVEEVVDYRTVRLGIDLGLNCGTTIDVRVKGVKALRSEEKQEEAKQALTEALAAGALTIATEKLDDDGGWLADVFVDGEALSL